jgi:hypothetical protein
VRAVGYAYPWDYAGDPEAAQRALDVGVGVVALAAAYHATRAVSPLSPTRRLLDVPESACYVPVRDEAWRGHRLKPSAPTWSDDPDLFGSAERRLTRAGLAVEAWIVLSHHDQLGREHPDLAVRNAFGDVYTYALCPRATDVRDYCVTLAEEIVRASPCRGVVLEACGPMGLDHASLHDKSEYARWSSTAQQLLSICFCDACESALADVGIDVTRLAQLVRDGVDNGADSVEESLGSELADGVASYRGTLSALLRREIVQGVHEVRDVEVTVHTSPDRWSTGAFPASGETGSFAGVTRVVANCWDGLHAAKELSSLALVVGDRCALGAYLRLDRGWDESSVESTIDEYVRSGMTELHLYHLGLLSRAGLDTARRVVKAGHERATGSKSEGPST